MDQVLNLSAFGEVLPDPSKRKERNPDITFGSFLKSKSLEMDPEEYPDMHAKSIDRIANRIAKEALNHSAQIKLFHWQTNSYAEHKALDSMFLEFIQLTDGLVESIMGKYGRPNFGGHNCELNVLDYSQENLEKYLESIYHCYSKDCKEDLNQKDDSEILNIIDEIIALIDKTRYLLSLK